MRGAEPVIAGRYRVVRPIGAGGMGRVWLAVDEMLDRDVAIKEVVIPGHLALGARELVREWTLQEAQAAARVSHPNVIRVYDVLEDQDRPLIVMEHVPSRSLLQLIERAGPLPVRRVASVGLALLSALEAARAAGVLHHDVKPSNVLIAHDGRVVLTDFGSAVTANGPGPLAGARTVFGSPDYLAPERLADGGTTELADLWSLGATLYHAVEGRPPYARDSTASTIRALTTAEPDPTRRAGPLAPVLAGLLRRDPAARMPAAEVARRFAALSGEEPPLPDPLGLPDGPATHPPAVARPAGHASVGVAASGAGAPAAGRFDGRAAGRTDDRWGDAPGRLAVRWAAVDGPAGRARRARPVAVLVAALAIVAAAAVAADRPPDLRPGGGLVAGPTAGPATGPGAGSTAGPSAGSGGGVAVSPAFVLPPGFTWRQDRTGFRVALPAAWRGGPRGAGTVLFSAPGGQPSLRIGPWTPGGGDPVTTLVAAERRVELPAYRRLRIEALPEPADGVWEYTYRDARDRRVRVLDRVVTRDGRAYLLEWRAPAGAWAAHLPAFAVAVESFRPPARD
ncbi:serine/threonine-protein kinase [Spirilliplanes yamanashiensis]|nr:serine/threonine-protein kinase [Spirilliplanes yamanashiensis]MDP9817332.1 hypothetical protein [Spirilliplanes yamanashiensis]